MQSVILIFQLQLINKTKTNEPITLKFDINGTGNLKLLELPPFELPNGFEKYDPKTDEQINRSGKISGTKKLSIC